MTARFSPDRKYRYTLERDNLGGKLTVGFICLNPSTADEKIDDSTVRRLIGYARRWNMGSLVLGNLFALRATDPKVMKAHPDPVGPDNDDALLEVGLRSAMVIAGWGAHGSWRNRDKEVYEIFREHDIPLFALGLTKAGDPRHPLYLRGDLVPRLFDTELTLG